MNWTPIFSYLLFLFILSFNSLAQPVNNDRQVLINSYSINKNNFNFTSQDIILSNTDSISFYYGLKSDGTLAKDPFLFRVSLKVGEDSSVFNTGQNTISYKGLADGKYFLSIGGFDLQRRWNAKPTVIKFEVDNQKAKLLNELDSLKRANEQIKQVPSLAKKDDSSNDIFIIIALTIVLTIVIILLATIIWRKIFLNKSQQTIQKRAVMSNSSNDIVSQDNYNKVVIENSELRAEIAALRGQIDALNIRGDQLGNQNKELQSNLNKLEHSKDELEELQKQKDELFAVVIHDIKNPASLIKSLVELLTSYDLTASEQQEIINDIAQTTSKIVSLSQEVTKILSLEGSKIHLNFDVNNMNEVIKDVNQRNQIAAKNKSINLFAELMESLPSAEFDYQKIDEIIDNLVSNAIKFTPTGGTIRVKSSKELNNLVVEVSDNGLGLTESDLQQTFKRGVKLSAQPTAGESSTGLGLWIVKKLVESHNGRVWVKSSLGKGSTFAFSIPLKQKKH